MVTEPGSPTRSDFQRDRDRIIHSTAFRRLKHKTQVFVFHEGDHFRTRLTHTIEVAQIARALARSLGLDEDLAEALALAHDLGHTPFGHTGEDALQACMQDHGGFDHNAQALRIVTRLERRYPNFDGLNLTWETLEGLAKLKPVFAARGSVTAGNSSQTSDGAGALILASEKAIKTHGLKPLARFVSYASRGVPPHIMGIGPIEAIPLALRHAGLKQDAIDWIELNEAFAAQSLAVIHTLGLDPAKVNPMGGAIALGHPLGATGAIRSATVVHALQRHRLRYGMVTMCVGMGQGAAGIFERV